MAFSVAPPVGDMPSIVMFMCYLNVVAIAQCYDNLGNVHVGHVISIWQCNKCSEIKMYFQFRQKA